MRLLIARKWGDGVAANSSPITGTSVNFFASFIRHVVFRGIARSLCGVLGVRNEYLTGEP